MLLNILLGVKLVDMCFLDPGTELELGVTFQIQATQDITMFHLFVETIKEGDEKITITVHYHN